MSFGFSISDLVLLVQLTSRAHTNWKNACGEYTEITGQLKNLHVVLERINKERKAPNSLLRDVTDHEGSLRILENSKTTVTQLSVVIATFKSLGGSRKGNWDRLRLASKDIGDMRSKLNLHVSALTAYLETIGLSALGRIEHAIGELPEMRKAIDKIASEIRAGRREGSVVATMTFYDGDDHQVWRELRRELISDGFSSNSIRKCKSQLKRYIRCLHEEGLLEEDAAPSPIEWSENEISPCGQPPTASDSIVASMSNSKELTKATLITVDGGSSGVILEHVTASGQVDDCKEPSKTFAATEESPNKVNICEKSPVEVQTVSGFDEHSIAGVDVLGSRDEDESIDRIEDSGAMRYDKARLVQFGAAKEGVSKCDDIDAVKDESQSPLVKPVEDGNHGHRGITSSTGRNDEHWRVNAEEEDTGVSQSVNGKPESRNHQRLTPAEPLEQFETQIPMSQETFPPSLADLDLEKMKLSSWFLTNTAYKVRATTDRRTPAEKADIYHRTDNDTESVSSMSATGLDVFPYTHKPTNSELDVELEEGHPCIDCLRARTDKKGQRLRLHDETCACKASTPPIGWTRLDYPEYGTHYKDEWAEGYDEECEFPLPPTVERYWKSPLPPGWTRIESISGQIYWQHESGVKSHEHPGFSNFIAFGCENHATCVRICCHVCNADYDTLGRRWIYLHDESEYDVAGICKSDSACQLKSGLRRERSRSNLEPKNGITNALSESAQTWVQLHTIEGRIFFRNSYDGADTYVDPRWIPQSKTMPGSMSADEATILYEWEYKLPKDWEQHHDDEGQIYFTKSHEGFATMTLIDPRWADSWDKLQRARKQSEGQVKRLRVILARQASKPRRSEPKSRARAENRGRRTNTVKRYSGVRFGLSWILGT